MLVLLVAPRGAQCCSTCCRYVLLLLANASAAAYCYYLLLMRIVAAAILGHGRHPPLNGRVWPAGLYPLMAGPCLD